MEPERLLKVRAAIEHEIERAGKMKDGPEAQSLKDILCFAIPIWNLVAPMFGMPVLPVPPFCNT